MNVEYGCSHYLGVDLEKELRDTYFICTAGIYIASILRNEDIFICHDVVRKKNLYKVILK